MRLLLLILTLVLGVLAWFGPPLDAEEWSRPLAATVLAKRERGAEWWLAYEPRYELRVELRAAEKDAAHRWIEVDARSFDAAAIGADLALVSYPFLAPFPAPAPDAFVAVELLARIAHPFLRLGGWCILATWLAGFAAAIALGAVRARAAARTAFAPWHWLALIVGVLTLEAAVHGILALSVLGPARPWPSGEVRYADAHIVKTEVVTGHHRRWSRRVKLGQAWSFQRVHLWFEADDRRVVSAVDAIDDTRAFDVGRTHTAVYTTADPHRARLVAEKRRHHAWNLAALEFFFLPITVLGVLIFAGPRRKWAALGAMHGRGSG